MNFLHDILQAQTLKEAAWSLTLLCSALAGGYAAYRLLFRLTLGWAGKVGKELEAAVRKYCRTPFLLAVLLIAAGFVLPLLGFSREASHSVKTFHSILFTVAVSWLLVGGIRVIEAVALERYDIRARDNLKARAVYTQINVFKNVASFVIFVIALAMILMNFEQVRQLGVSLLASAGVAGIIIGFAAQKSIATIFAGIQIAITQPIRIDDVVIVENEWGWIEEITLTYVVVRIWDLRRLVVPITYFIERPFQNWTRTSADILGSVFIYADYSLPVGEVREELRRIVQASPHWDGKVCGLQVTNATDKTVEFRALMSAADSPSAWDLRCEVREKLISFLQANHPESLPRIRASLESGKGPEMSSGAGGSGEG